MNNSKMSLDNAHYIFWLILLNAPSTTNTYFLFVMSRKKKERKKDVKENEKEKDTTPGFVAGPRLAFLPDEVPMMNNNLAAKRPPPTH